MNALARGIIDRREPSTLSLCFDGLWDFVGSMCYVGVGDFCEMVQLEVGRKDKKKRPKKLRK